MQNRLIFQSLKSVKSCLLLAFHDILNLKLILEFLLSCLCKLEKNINKQMRACCKIKEHFLRAWNVMLALNIAQPVSELAYFLSTINCSENFKSVFRQQKKS